MPTPWSEGDKAQVTIALQKLTEQLEHVTAIAALLRERRVENASEAINILCFALASLLQSKVGREKMLEMYEATVDLLKHYMLESNFIRAHRCDEGKD